MKKQALTFLKYIHIKKKKKNINNKTRTLNISLFLENMRYIILFKNLDMLRKIM